jgi:hypothetical protein
MPRDAAGGVAAVHRALSVCAVFAAFCVVAQAVLHFLNMWLWDWRYPAFDAGSGSAIFEILGKLALVVATAAAWTLVVEGGADRRARVVLALLMSVLVVDDMFTLHAAFNEYWPLVYLPILAPTAVLLWRLAAAQEPAVRRFIRSAVVLLALSPFGEKIVGRILHHLGQAPRDTLYELKVVVTQSCELLGWILLASGLVAVAVASNTTRRRKEALAPARAAG